MVLLLYMFLAMKKYNLEGYMSLIDMLKVAWSLVVSNLQRFWPLFLVSSIGAIVFAYGSVVTTQAITQFGS